MKSRTKAIGYGIILLWMFGPLIPAIVAGVIAASFDCKLDEGNVHPCIVFGKDIGQTLYRMGVMGWFFLFTFPTGIPALIVFSLVVWWRNRTARNQDAKTESGDSDTTKQDWVLWLGLASVLFSFLTSIPALIISARARPLATRAKIGATVAIVTLIANVVLPIAIWVLQRH